MIISDHASSNVTTLGDCVTLHKEFGKECKIIILISGFLSHLDPRKQNTLDIVVLTNPCGVTDGETSFRKSRKQFKKSFEVGIVILYIGV